MQYISITDYLLLPVYIVLLYLLVKSKAEKYKSIGLGYYYFANFFLHMAGAILYALVIQYYYGYGDSLGFFRGSTFLSSISKEEVTLKYFFYSPEQLSNLFLSSETGDNVIGAVINNSSNLMVIKISAVLSFFTFNSYLLTNLFFGLFSFVGTWRLFLTFNEILKNKAQKLLAFTTLYIPSIWFWGSGLIKDSICMGCLGVIVYILYKLFIKKKAGILNLVALVICFLVLLTVKSYIAVALLVALVVFAVSFFISSRKTPIEKWIYMILISVSGILIFNFLLSSYLEDIISDSQAAIESFKNVYESLDANGDSGSGFINKTSDFSVFGILLQSPGALFTTLFRPFIWEFRNLMMVLSCVESAVSLVAILYLIVRLRFIKFFNYLFRDPYILFAFVFVVILGIIIGFTTFNFGTMVRYRIPLLPFYSFMLIGIYVKYRDQKTLH